MSTRSLRFATSTSRCAPRRVVSRGFSTRTCLPAPSACSTTPWWVAGGVTTSTQSQSVFSSAPSSVAWLLSGGSPSSSSAKKRASGAGSTTATSSSRSAPRTTSAQLRPQEPRPTWITPREGRAAPSTTPLKPSARRTRPGCLRVPPSLRSSRSGRISSSRRSPFRSCPGSARRTPGASALRAVCYARAVLSPAGSRRGRVCNLDTPSRRAPPAARRSEECRSGYPQKVTPRQRALHFCLLRSVSGALPGRHLDLRLARKPSTIHAPALVGGRISLPQRLCLSAYLRLMESNPVVPARQPADLDPERRKLDRRWRGFAGIDMAQSRPFREPGRDRERPAGLADKPDELRAVLVDQAVDQNVRPLDGHRPLDSRPDGERLVEA